MLTLITCLMAGLGAGIATGFAGLSAATVITPFLIALLGFRTYEAVAIALASDILASAVASWTYYKNKNLDIKNGVVMMMTTMLFTLIGSVIAKYLPQAAMGNLQMLMTGLLGLKFIVFPVSQKREWSFMSNETTRSVVSGVCGVYIGLVCGIVGAGGGMMMLMILVMVLGYDLKTAVGTSTFIMTFTAGTGAVSHFALGEGIDIPVLILCIIFTFLGSMWASKIANGMQPKTMNRITGVILVIVAVLMTAIDAGWIF